MTQTFPTLLDVLKGIRVVKLCLGSPSISTGIQLRAEKRAFMFSTRGSMLINVGKQSSSSSTFSQLGTSTGIGTIVGDVHSLDDESLLKSIKGSSNPWKGVSSMLGGLTVGVEGAVVLASGVRADVEVESLSEYVLSFLAKEGSTASFCYLSQNLTLRLVAIYFFSSS